MLWSVEFDADILVALKRSNPNALQQQELKRLIVDLHSVTDPEAFGGAYHEHWAYTFCSTGLLHCKLDKTRRVILIFDVTF